MGWLIGLWLIVYSFCFPMHKLCTVRQPAFLSARPRLVQGQQRQGHSVYRANHQPFLLLFLPTPAGGEKPIQQELLELFRNMWVVFWNAALFLAFADVLHRSLDWCCQVRSITLVLLPRIHHCFLGSGNGLDEFECLMLDTKRADHLGIVRGCGWSSSSSGRAAQKCSVFFMTWAGS